MMFFPPPVNNFSTRNPVPTINFRVDGNRINRVPVSFRFTSVNTTNKFETDNCSLYCGHELMQIFNCNLPKYRCVQIFLYNVSFLFLFKCIFGINWYFPSVISQYLGYSFTNFKQYTEDRSSKCLTADFQFFEVIAKNTSLKYVLRTELYKMLFYETLPSLFYLFKNQKKKEEF